jgi:preprotein translocase subunit SecG
MFTFLLVVHALIAASLVGVILLQRSEGGGLGMGGSPTGLMSARGAADFLTRATAILAVLFISLSIALAAIASARRTPSTLDTSLVRTPAAIPAAGAPAAAGVVPGNAAGPAEMAVPPLPETKPVVPPASQSPVPMANTEVPKRPTAVRQQVQMPDIVTRAPVDKPKNVAAPEAKMAPVPAKVQPPKIDLPKAELPKPAPTPVAPSGPPADSATPN